MINKDITYTTVRLFTLAITAILMYRDSSLEGALGFIFVMLLAFYAIPWSITTLLTAIFGESPYNYDGTLYVDMTNPEDVYHIQINVPIEEIVARGEISIKVDNQEET